MYSDYMYIFSLTFESECKVSVYLFRLQFGQT